MTDPQVFGANILEEISLKEQLSEASLAMLEHHSRCLRPALGDTVIHKGDRMDSVFLVESGKLRVYAMDSEGNELSLIHI